MRDTDDLYRILQVDPSADSETIEAAYKAQAKKYHPDRNPLARRHAEDPTAESCPRSAPGSTPSGSLRPGAPAGGRTTRPGRVPGGVAEAAEQRQAAAEAQARQEAAQRKEAERRAKEAQAQAKQKADRERRSWEARAEELQQRVQAERRVEVERQARAEAERRAEAAERRARRAANEAAEGERGRPGRPSAAPPVVVGEDTWSSRAELTASAVIVVMVAATALLWNQGPIRGQRPPVPDYLDEAAVAAAAKVWPSGAAHLDEIYERRPGRVFSDCDLCPTMVVVPPGTFRMGSNDGVRTHQPVRDVRVRVFALGRYEVTVEEYATFVAASGHVMGDGCYVTDRRGGTVWDSQASWRVPGFEAVRQAAGRVRELAGCAGVCAVGER